MNFSKKFIDHFFFFPKKQSIFTVPQPNACPFFFSQMYNEFFYVHWSFSKKILIFVYTSLFWLSKSGSLVNVTQSDLNSIIQVIGTVPTTPFIYFCLHRNSFSDFFFGQRKIKFSLTTNGFFNFNFNRNKNTSLEVWFDTTCKIFNINIRLMFF